MGRQIVYCEGCGHNLREDDFEKGRGRMIDNRPFCTECRPFRAGEGEQGRRSPSGKIPAGGAPARKTSTGAIPIIPAPRRSPTSVTGSNPLPLLAGVGGLIFVILIFAVTQSGSRRVPVPAPVTAPILPVDPPVARRVDPLPPPPPPPSPPPPTRGTPPPPAAPSGPLVAPTASEKLDAFLAQIRGIIQSDERQERAEEILHMFSAATKFAGARSTEVSKMKSDYLATLNDTIRRAVAWGDWRITSSAESSLLPSHNGRDSVYQTHPLDKTTPAKLERSVEVPAGKKSTFSFWVSCHQTGDFELRVYIDEKQVMKETIGPPGSGWRQRTVDLTPFAGKTIALRVENAANDWNFEHGYWSDFVIVSE